MDIADIMLHIPTDLAARERASIERDRKGCDGLVSAHFSTCDAHMLEVAYDPRPVDTETLRRHVSERGLQFTMVGR